MMIQTEFTFPSALQGQEIFAVSWRKGGGQYRGVVQIVHGMQEHIGRYAAFAVYLAERGFVVYGSDHLGHGKSVRKETDFGYFGSTDGWKNLLADLHTLMCRAKAEYPDLPYILIGHSMGSFLAREFAAVYGDTLDMAVFLGTSAGSCLLKPCIRSIEKKAEKRGRKTPATEWSRLAFGVYHRRIHPKRTNYDWLSTVETEVDAFILHPLCGRAFTYGGYRDLFTLLKRVSGMEWAYRLPKNLPILLASGKGDPVGAYGKGVRRVAKWLLRADCRKVSVKLYAHLRHELLHESRKEEIYADLYQWMCRYLPQNQEKKKGLGR